jgi:hypothetical protein
MIGDKSILSEDLRYFLVMGECELNRINQPGARSPYFMLPLPVELTEPMFESKTRLSGDHAGLSGRRIRRDPLHIQSYRGRTCSLNLK